MPEQADVPSAALLTVHCAPHPWPSHSWDPRRWPPWSPLGHSTGDDAALDGEAVDATLDPKVALLAPFIVPRVCDVPILGGAIDTPPDDLHRVCTDVLLARRRENTRGVDLKLSDEEHRGLHRPMRNDVRLDSGLVGVDLVRRAEDMRRLLGVVRALVGRVGVALPEARGRIVWRRGARRVRAARVVLALGERVLEAARMVAIRATRRDALRRNVIPAVRGRPTIAAAVGALAREAARHEIDRREARHLGAIVSDTEAVGRGARCRDGVA
eukprot:6964102-Prymnesium_polylepis.1